MKASAVPSDPSAIMDPIVVMLSVEIEMLAESNMTKGPANFYLTHTQPLPYLAEASTTAIMPSELIVIPSFRFGDTSINKPMNPMMIPKILLTEFFSCWSKYMENSTVKKGVVPFNRAPSELSMNCCRFQFKP